MRVIDLRPEHFASLAEPLRRLRRNAETATRAGAQWQASIAPTAAALRKVAAR